MKVKWRIDGRSQRERDGSSWEQEQEQQQEAWPAYAHDKAGKQMPKSLIYDGAAGAAATITITIEM